MYVSYASPASQRSLEAIVTSNSCRLYYGLSDWRAGRLVVDEQKTLPEGTEVELLPHDNTLSASLYYTFDDHEVIVRAIWGARRERGLAPL